MEKRVLSTTEIEAQAVFELPDRELMRRFRLWGPLLVAAEVDDILSDNEIEVGDIEILNNNTVEVEVEDSLNCFNILSVVALALQCSEVDD